MTYSTLRAALLAALLAACGDNIDPGAPGPDAPTGATRALVTSGDFRTTGLLSTIGLPSMQVTPNAAAGVVSADPITRLVGRELFIVNRTGSENISIVDADTLQLVGDQIPTGAGSNPQDVAVVGNKLYVPVLGGSGVVVLDRTDPAARKEISLAALDPDGKPDCNSAYAVGNEVFVSCGLLDGFAAVRNGRVAVIDTERDELISDFDLGAKNPLGLFARAPQDSMFAGDLLMATVPSFDDYSTGCLTRIAVGDTLEPRGCAVTNQALGGYVNRAEPSPDGATLWLAVVGYASPGFMDPFGRLVGVDLETGAVAAPLSATTSMVQDVAACPGGWLVAGDSTQGASGVRVYRDGAEVTTALLDIGRPPSTVGFNIHCL
jgi:DNA-binding beta-propeller fold protein YncE